MRFTVPPRRTTARTATAVAVLAAVALAAPAAGASEGVGPKPVQFSDPQLEAALVTLNSSELIPGTAWGLDPALGRVVVTADPTVTGTRATALAKILEPLGTTVRLQRTDKKFESLLSGGEAIYGSADSPVQARCSLGFNVRRAGKPDALLTAGHCGNPVKSWSLSQAGPQVALVPDGGSSFPGNDYALAEYTDTSVAHPSEVFRQGLAPLPVTGARDAVVGEAVSRIGSTTGLHGADAGEPGQITGLDYTVNYEEGRVTGLTRTNVCAEPGDSGGAFYFTNGDGTATAAGLTSGGNGDCTTGGTVFFQPVVEALDAFGATVG
ncbi:S1 family peptidase [uncultured Streptomyces sp.]|uniref:S1 family peptidase n=1 Tax=uncultured Streptomyces sp. TaxID=174707 RepID=UPI00260B83C1|nr:S1 family peptidase [uncultured Streptomyces sp.]